MKDGFICILIDATEVLIGFIKSISVEILYNETSMVPKKMDAGGQSAARFQRAREIALNQWFKDCNQKLLDISQNMPDTKILIGINKCNETEFFNNAHTYIKQKIIGQESVSYININGCLELIEKCNKQLQEFSVSKEKIIVEQFAERLAKNDNSITYGINNLNKTKNKLILFSDMCTDIEKEKIKSIGCEWKEFKGYTIIDALKICIINYY